MLLYDRVNVHAAKLMRSLPANEFGRRNVACLQMLRSASVFNVTGIMPLFGDWGRECGRPIPRNPPSNTVWAEWELTEEDEHGSIDWVFGSLIVLACKDAVRLLVGQDESMDGMTYYRVIMFYMKLRQRGEESRESVLGYGLNPYVIASNPCDCFVRHKPDGSGVEMVWRAPFHEGDDDDAVTEAMQRNSFFHTHTLIPLRGNGIDTGFGPWPPFMAFSLLNCKNVETETHEPDRKERRRVERAGEPPRAVYKTIKIKLPQVHRGREESGDPTQDEQRSVRFHLCRGHFKDLRHPRFKNPGLHWWPHHWRGSKEAGEVVKKYELTS